MALALVSVTLFELPASTRHGHGILTHEVRSAYQAGDTQIRVLLPDKIDPARSYPVIYVLPVGRQSDPDWFGDGLLEVWRLDLHNKHQAIFVMPTFSATPWYCDHPSDRALRQESHLLHTVVPYVERTYPALKVPEGRHLLGFSKSGWGAWTLLLRHPDVFGRALAWDAPMMMDKIGPWDTQRIFGTQENFESYRLSDLARTQGPKLGKATRLFMTGFGEFRNDHQRMDELLTKLSIPHEHRDGPQRKHDWRSGWIDEAVDLLVSKP